MELLITFDTYVRREVCRVGACDMLFLGSLNGSVVNNAEEKEIPLIARIPLIYIIQNYYELSRMIKMFL